LAELTGHVCDLSQVTTGQSVTSGVTTGQSVTSFGVHPFSLPIVTSDKKCRAELG